MAKKDKVSPEDALELALSSIKKKFGAGSVMQGIDKVPGVETFTSGCMSIDQALGGGWARGRIIEVYGKESSGKTTCCLHAIAEVQKLGQKCAFIDAEHAIDSAYASNLGVNFEELVFAQPDSGEEALQIAEMLTKSGAIGLIVVDSVAALTPRAELEGQIGDSHMGRQARLMGQAMRMITSAAHNTNTTVMFVNQLRDKLGIMFGNSETTPGGNALKFYASQRVDIRRIGGIKEGDKLVANETRLKVIKNKIAAPFKQAEFVIKYGEGIDYFEDLLKLAIEKKIIVQGGAGYYKYQDAPLCQGKANVLEKLKTDLEFQNAIKEQVIL